MMLFVCPQGCIKYAFEDGTPYELTAAHLYFTEFKMLVADMNSANTTVVMGVSPPDDEFIVGKYNWIDGAFQLNPDWVPPPLLEY